MGDEFADLVGSVGDGLGLALGGDGLVEPAPVARSIVWSVPWTARPTAVP